MDPVFKSAIFHLEPMPGRPARHVVRHPGGVVVLPVHGDDFLLIRNHRRAIGHTLLEVPAGTLEHGEDPKHAAVRELAEETTSHRGVGSSFGHLWPAPVFAMNAFVCSSPKI